MIGPKPRCPSDDFGLDDRSSWDAGALTRANRPRQHQGAGQREALAAEIESGCERVLVCYRDLSPYLRSNVQNGDLGRVWGAAELDLTLYSLS